MEATAAGLTTGTLGAFTVVHGAATQIALTGSTADLTSGATRVLTATIQDAAGNTVTADNTTVVTFAKAVRRRHRHRHRQRHRRRRRRHEDDHRRPRRLGHDGSHRAPGSPPAPSAPSPSSTAPRARSRSTHSGSTASGDNHTLTATIQDAAGNTVTSDSSTVVAFAKTGGAGTVTGLGNATASSGVATRVVVNAASGQIDLDAQAAGLDDRHDQLHDRRRQRLDADEHDHRLPHLDRRQRVEHERDHRPAEGRRRQRPRPAPAAPSRSP